MASISAVTFNSGSTIDGTIQVGQLAIGSTPQDYTNEPGGLRWWSSADLESGYIIAHVNENANQPNSQGISGVKVGFWRTQFTDSDFISWAEYIAKRYHTPQTFSTATEANTWLFDNGYWTSYQNETNLLVYLDSGNILSYPTTGSTWFDLEGTSNNATLFNSPTFSPSYDGILQFDDASLEYATIPDLGNLTQWTVEAWFRLSSPLTGKVTSIVSNEFDLVDKLNFSIGTNNQPTNANLSVGFYDGTWKTTTGVVPQVGVWYQVVGTYDGSVIRQYINGVASGGTLNYVGTPESGGEVRLMRRWDGNAIQSNLVDGDLAIVKIYNTAISDSDVLNNYNSTYTRFIDVTPTPTPTITPTSTPIQETPTPTVSETATSTPTPSVTPSPTNAISASCVNVLSYKQFGNGFSVNDPGYMQLPTGTPFSSATIEYRFNNIDSNGTNAWNIFENLLSGDTILVESNDFGYNYINYQVVTPPVWNGLHWFIGQVSVLDTNTNSRAVFTLSSNVTFTINSLCPSPTPTNTPTETPTQTPTITPTSTEVPVTPTPTPSITPTITPTSSEVPVTPTPTPTTTSGFTVTIQEVGSDVVWSGSGFFDLTNLSLFNSTQISAGFNANDAIWAVGPITETNVELYESPLFNTFPASFGTGGAPASSGNGDIFGVLLGSPSRSLMVPASYVSGTVISGSTTYSNTTISGLNLTLGTYTYSWGTNPGETLTLIVG